MSLGSVLPLERVWCSTMRLLLPWLALFMVILAKNRSVQAAIKLPQSLPCPATEKPEWSCSSVPHLGNEPQNVPPEGSKHTRGLSPLLRKPSSGSSLKRHMAQKWPLYVGVGRLTANVREHERVDQEAQRSHAVYEWYTAYEKAQGKVS